MRNTKIALAVLALAASTAAMAETTIYGTLDAAVGNTGSSGGTTQGTYFSGAGGWVAGNNIGFKGSEDLEGGMKATYQLEMGLNLNNGAADNGGGGSSISSAAGNTTGNSVSSSIFTRTAAIGLSSEMGSLTLGQQLSPYIAAQAAGTAGNGNFFVNRIFLGGGSTLGGLHNAAVGSTVDGQGGFFMPNAVVYASPTIGGLSASLMKTFRNNAGQAEITSGAVADAYTAGMVNGSFGGVNVTAGFQDRNNSYKSYTGSASYAMGPATVYGNYTRHTEEGGTAVGSYSASLAYAVTEPLTLSLQYARNNLTEAQTLTNVGAQYALSKRTSVYATYGRGTNGAQSVYDNRTLYDNTSVTSTSTLVGVTHSF